MKPIVILLLLSSIFFGCKNDSLLSFEPLKIEEKKCDTCPIVKISIPKALEKNDIDNTINTSLREEIITLLNFDDTTEVNSIEAALASFKKGYAGLMEKFPEEATKWEATVTGEIIYEDKNVISISLNSYLFTGGAHGYSTTRHLNFNKKKGVELENWGLFNTKFDFVKFAEHKFRTQESIPQNAPINSTGFMFEEGVFLLPENIGYTHNGLELLYNQYEIAPFTEGPITLTIPYKEAKKYLQIPLPN